MKILAVDDDPLFLEVVTTSLDHLGYQDVTLASSAPEALAALDNASVPFDCCLFDIQMPEMDGITLIGATREKPAYKHTPILMLTHASDRAVIDDAFSAGAIDYLNKPLDWVELKARMQVLQSLKQYHSHIKEAEDKFQSIFDIHPSFMAIVEKTSGLIVNINDSFISFFKINRNKVIGRSILDLDLFLENQKDEKPLLEILNHKLPFFGELRAKNGD